jgi:hypothetical protein
LRRNQQINGVEYAIVINSIHNRYILDTWIKINNKEKVEDNSLNYIFAYMGLRKSKRAASIDATL